MKVFGFLFGASMIFSFALVIVYCCIQDVKLNQNCTGHLKRAADASTVEMALSELLIATNYLEANRMTSGSTSILWDTPATDIGYWYQNLKNSEEELRKVDHSTSQTERTNVLMKLRETIVDHEKDGDVITCPQYLSVFPHQSLINGLFISTLLFAIIGFIVCFLIATDL